MLIIKIYASLFLSIGLAFCAAFVLGCYWITRSASNAHPTGPDLSAIAGDDMIATKLDLARAYIETNNKQAAKKILKSITSEGNREQKQKARSLLELV